MWRLFWITTCLAIAGCNFPTLAALSGDATSGDAKSNDAATLDATLDATPTTLVITASSSTFDLHAADTRDPVFTVTNGTTQTTGTPSLQVTGLTLGAMTFPVATNTCTGSLAVGASCTAVGHLTATTAGQVTFQVSATASPGGTAMVSLPITVMEACPATCGSNGTSNCCASAVVPGNAPGATLAGAAFYRSYDVGSDGAYPDMSFPATVSDARFDTYLITVGRFRAFVNAQTGNGTQANAPAEGAGGRTLNGMANQGGWDTSFNASLVANTATLVFDVKCNSTYQTWTDTAGANEALPMNCITWYEAMAFCIWDGGFLPTEAEWNYAAAGGSEQRAYPWSSPAGSLTIDCTYANYDPGTACVAPGTNRVGSESPKGDSKWAQSDLGGNLFELVLDWYVSPYPTTTCNDCAYLTAASSRVLRGGGFFNAAAALRGAPRNGNTPTGRYDFVGARCARTP